jgi:pimeloyl-ACP methyl ester carboxylesterase
MTTHTHQTAPTQFVEANGIRFAYRRFGKTGGVPIVMNIHFRGTMDHWDPAVTDGLAAQREVILFDNAGIGASTGETPSTIPGMATDAIAFIKALGIGKTDVLGYSVGGKVAQEIAVQAPDLVRKLVLVGTGPRGADTAASKSAEIFSATYDRRAFPAQCNRPRGRTEVPRTQVSPQGPQPGGERGIGHGAVRGDRQVKREDRRSVGLPGRYPSSDSGGRRQQRPDHTHDQRIHAAAAPAERATHRLSGFEPRASEPVPGALRGPHHHVPGCITKTRVVGPVGRASSASDRCP